MTLIFTLLDLSVVLVTLFYSGIEFIELGMQNVEKSLSFCLWLEKNVGEDFSISDHVIDDAVFVGLVGRFIDF